MNDPMARWERRQDSQYTRDCASGAARQLDNALYWEQEAERLHQRIAANGGALVEFHSPVAHGWSQPDCWTVYQLNAPHPDIPKPREKLGIKRTTTCRSLDEVNRVMAKLNVVNEPTAVINCCTLCEQRRISREQQ